MTETGVPEVREYEADGKVGAVFEDIRSTLHSPTVGQLFRRLAVYPWYLQLAWRNLKPNAAICFFDRSAADIRRAAAEGVAHSAGLPAGVKPDADLVSAAQVFYDLDAKLLLITGLLRAGTNGQVPKMNMIGPDDKRSVSAGQAPSGKQFAELDARIFDAKQDTSIDDVYTGTGIASGQLDFSVLSAASSAFAQVWDAVRPVMESPSIEDSVAHLRTITIGSTEAMPFRMEISATACRQSGLSEDQIDGVRRIINDAWLNLPRLTLAMAAMHGAAGGAQDAELLTAAVATVS